jgi:hypothetical protein
MEEMEELWKKLSVGGEGGQCSLLKEKDPAKVERVMKAYKNRSSRSEQQLEGDSDRDSDQHGKN